jgi:hypothetical protein
MQAWTRPQMPRYRHDSLLTTDERLDGEKWSLAFFCEFPGARAGTAFERTTDVWTHGIDATNESTAHFDAQSSAMAVFDLHEATIADEMRVGSRFIVQAVVIDAEDTNVFGKRGEAAGAAEKAIGGDWRRRRTRRHEGMIPTNYGQALGQEPPQSMPFSSPF